MHRGVKVYAWCVCVRFVSYVSIKARVCVCLRSFLDPSIRDQIEMRLSIQVDSGATPYSARIPSVAELFEGAAVVTIVAVGNSKWLDDDEGEVAEAAEEDDDDDEGDGADDEEEADDFLQGIGIQNGPVFR